MIGIILDDDSGFAPFVNLDPAKAFEAGLRPFTPIGGARLCIPAIVQSDDEEG